MRCAPSLDLEQLAVRTEGASGAALNQLCILAGRIALVRQLENPSTDVPSVTQADFEKAFLDSSSSDIRRRPIGF
jgi:ATP-dependent 26S proteasome regulatory subunit